MRRRSSQQYDGSEYAKLETKNIVKELNISDAAQANKYVVDLCKQNGSDGIRIWNKDKSEYQLVTNYLTDIQILEDLTDAERKPILECAHTGCKLGKAKNRFPENQTPADGLRSLRSTRRKKRIFRRNAPGKSQCCRSGCDHKKYGISGSPTRTPTVCKMMDYCKFCFRSGEAERKPRPGVNGRLRKCAMKSQHGFNDFDTKVKAAQSNLNKAAT